MIKRPDRMDLVQEYMTKRIERADDDPDAREAFRFWRDNLAEIERDCVVSNASSFDGTIHEDGEPLELSAIQSYFNKVADWGEEAVATEIDNDPPEEVGPQGSGLSWQMVAGRLSGLDRGQLPANASCITAAIDLGKYLCHWVVIAWWKGAGGCVIDYGRAEVVGTDKGMDNQASEPQIYKSLLNWRDEILSKKYVDAAGAARKVDAVFVDSGTFTDAAYQFVRDVGGTPFYVSKGIGNYRDKTTETDKIKPGNHFHAAYQETQGLWLYELNTDYWKQFIHERFLTPTFDEQNFLRRGALSLFNQPGDKKHTSYAQHIVAEELVSEFKEGKGLKTYWNVVSDNNHWLDATYNAAAAASARGIYLLSPTPDTPNGQSVTARPKAPNEQAQQKLPAGKPAGQRHGAPKKRAGGWVNSLRRR
jgi:phage terminase large subunit GpA-like protein